MEKTPHSPEATTPFTGVDESTYSILRGDRQGVYQESWNTDYLLARYAQQTDGLIGKMDGSIPLSDCISAHYDSETGGVEIDTHADMPAPDSVIFLDKSARPISWMVSRLWNTLAQDGAVCPERHYLNIDKEDWLRQMGVEESSLQDAERHEIDYSKITRSDIEGIRALFVEGATNIKDGELGDVWQRKTVFDNKHVMIVDEVKSSGRTLEIALHLLAEAFPEAEFIGEYWVNPGRHLLETPRPGKKEAWAANWVPVWYSSTNEAGRAVGNKNYRYYDEYAQRTGKVVAMLGRHVLSAPQLDGYGNRVNLDSATIKLSKDIQQLNTDLLAHKLLFMPSVERGIDGDPDGFEKQAMRVNELTDFSQWRVAKNELLKGNTVKKK